MAFYDAASNKSLWRGVDYYKEGRVASFSSADSETIHGCVEGSEGNSYDVTIDISHPKRSTCNCPFASGRRVVCKHMVALYFTAIPGSYEAFKKDLRQWEIQNEIAEERWRQDELAHIRQRVRAMTAKEAKEMLVNILYQDSLEQRYRNDRWR